MGYSSWGRKELDATLYTHVVDLQYCVSFRYIAKLFFSILFHYMLLQDSEYTVNPCLFYIY